MVVVCLFFDYMRYNYCPTTERIRAMAVIAVYIYPTAYDAMVLYLCKAPYEPKDVGS